jgi:glycosyltransferase involved in cell wall biosynthesis
MVGEKEILISVVVPTFNSLKYLKQTITSALQQSHRQIEVIVVDDGSADGTPRMVQSFGDPRIVLREISHRGVSGARNVGVATARAQFIAFLDHDDVWYAPKLERQIQRLANDARISVVGCFMDLITSTGKVFGKTGQVPRNGDQDLIAVGKLLPFPMSASLFRKGALEQAGGFDEKLTTSSTGGVDDLDLFSRLAPLGRIDCVSEILGAYRHHTESFTASNFALQRAGTRFVQARRRAEREGTQLTWEDFQNTYRSTIQMRREDTAAAAYYSAGLHAAEGQYLTAVVGGLKSAVLAPRYTTRRLLVNRPWDIKRQSKESRS